MNTNQLKKAGHFNLLTVLDNPQSTAVFYPDKLLTGQPEADRPRGLSAFFLPVTEALHQQRN